MNCYLLLAETSPDWIGHEVSPHSSRNLFQHFMDTRHGFGATYTRISKHRLVILESETALAAWKGMRILIHSRSNHHGDSLSCDMIKYTAVLPTLPLEKYGPRTLPARREANFTAFSTALSEGRIGSGVYSNMGNIIGARARGTAQSSTTNPSRGFFWSRRSRTEVIHGPTGRPGGGSGRAMQLAS